jgi:hypothetical protein
MNGDNSSDFFSILCQIKKMEKEPKDPSTSEAEVARLFRVYRTVHEMVKDRVLST